MAANGINVFDPQIEHQFSSNKVKRERANLMVAYLEKYPQMLPDSLDLKKIKTSLDNNRIVRCLAEAWCYVYKQKLSGTDLYQLDPIDPNASPAYDALKKINTPRYTYKIT